MTSKYPQCPSCGHDLIIDSPTCAQCGHQLRHKKFREAYFTWTGLGLFDLIPGIRDLSFKVRLLVMILFIGTMVFMFTVGPFICMIVFLLFA